MEGCYVYLPQAVWPESGWLPVCVPIHTACGLLPPSAAIFDPI